MAITWTITVVEYDIGFSTWPKLAFSPSGQPSIVYHSSSQHGIRFATRTAAGDWTKATVVSGLAGDSFCFFRFAPDGHPAISYSKADTINYAQFRGSMPWDTVEVTALGDPHYGMSSSLAFDPLHFRPNISVYSKRGLEYFQGGPNTSVWISSTADGTANGHFNVLDFDGSGQPCIAYQDSDVVKTAYFDGGQWNILTVGPGNGWCSLIFGTQPALTYTKLGSVSTSTPDSVVLARALVPLVAWNIETAITEPADSSSLAIPPGGGLAISYHAIGPASIKYTVWNGGSGWLTSQIERSGKDQAGNFVGDFVFTSLAFNPATGQPAIAYYDRASASIKYAEGTES